MINLHTSLGKMGKTMAFFSATGALLWQPYRPLVFVGESMSPTYHSGEYVVTVANDGVLQRGDVVVVEMPDGPIVKRVSHLAGDEMTQLKVDGEWTDMIEMVMPPSGKFDGKRYRKVRIPEGHVYVLGDNRTISLDSRVFGAVPLTKISRKVLNPRTIIEK
ncbi:MAG: signal peptidase I [Fimbriimonas sp.]